MYIYIYTYTYYTFQISIWPVQLWQFVYIVHAPAVSQTSMQRIDTLQHIAARFHSHATLCVSGGSMCLLRSQTCQRSQLPFAMDIHQHNASCLDEPPVAAFFDIFPEKRVATWIEKTFYPPSLCIYGETISPLTKLRNLPEAFLHASRGHGCTESAVTLQNVEEHKWTKNNPTYSFCA